MTESYLRPEKKSQGENFFGKLAQSTCQCIQGNLGSHVHAQGRTYGQEILEKPLHFPWLMSRFVAGSEGQGRVVNGMAKY